MLCRCASPPCASGHTAVAGERSRGGRRIVAAIGRASEETVTDQTDQSGLRAMAHGLSGPACADTQWAVYRSHLDRPNVETGDELVGIGLRG
jgi:hypothetical protein